jgi:hypothetical protein
MIHMLRDPVVLVQSWLKRGWGRRFGTDPRSMDHAFVSSRGPIPWYATAWKTNYHDLGEVDRIVRSLETAIRLAKAGWRSLPARRRAKVAFVSFEDLCADPRPTVWRLAGFLDAKPGPGLAGALKRFRGTPSRVCGAWRPITTRSGVRSRAKAYAARVSAPARGADASSGWTIFLSRHCPPLRSQALDRPR